MTGEESMTETLEGPTGVVLPTEDWDEETGVRLKELRLPAVDVGTGSFILEATEVGIRIDKDSKASDGSKVPAELDNESVA